MPSKLLVPIKVLTLVTQTRSRTFYFRYL